MLLVQDVDNKEYLTGLFNSMYDELPVPKPKKKKYCPLYDTFRLAVRQ